MERTMDWNLIHKPRFTEQCAYDYMKQLESNRQFRKRYQRRKESSRKDDKKSKKSSSARDREKERPSHKDKKD